MSFWKSLFGGKAGDVSLPKVLRQIEHKGFTIEAAPYPEGGQYQVAGTVSRTVDGVRQEHRFIRADRFASSEDAAEVALMKGRQLVDQQGERMFASPPTQA